MHIETKLYGFTNPQNPGEGKFPIVQARCTVTGETAARWGRTYQEAEDLACRALDPEPASPEGSARLRAHTIRTLCRDLSSHDWYHGMADRPKPAAQACERRILEATEELAKHGFHEDVLAAWRLAAPDHLGTAYGASPTAPNWVREALKEVAS